MNKIGIILSILICIFDGWLFHYTLTNMELWYAPIVFISVVSIACFDFLHFIFSYITLEGNNKHRIEDNKKSCH